MLAITRLRSSGSLRQSPMLLAAVTVTLGLGAHVVGGGATIDCIPLLIAALLGVVTTLSAQRLAGHAYRGAPIAVLMLGVGQFGMHLALSGHRAIDQPVESLFGLTCGLIVTHTVATAVLAVLLLGAHQSAEVALHLLSRARRHVQVFVTLSPPSVSRRRAKAAVFSRVWDRQARHSQQWRFGLARPRRGPPAPVV